MGQGNDNTKGLPDEAAVLADIRYYEARIAEHGDACSPRQNASLQVCRLLLRQRRQLLAAIRDGAPERWPEYSAE
ncbi:MAG TPA: hypothetical protein VF254_06045 [Gammaproteobacteria bacterium]|jgi:hypothetical protein